MMTLWNKVFTAFPYLDDIRFGIDKGLIRVGSVRFEGFIEIFVVDVSIRRCNCLSFVVAISTSSFDLFSDKIRFLQPSVLVVKDCKSVLLGVFSQPIAVARSRRKSQVVFVVFNALCDNDVCRCLFPTAFPIFFSGFGGRQTIY